MTEGTTTLPGPPSDESEPDLSRRRMLTAATAAVGAVGVGLAATPFIESMEPSETARALGAPVTIDISTLEPKQMLVASWRRRPIYVLRRTEAELKALSSLNGQLKDPLSKADQQPANLPGWNPVQRSIVPEYLVVVGICTHLGCMPKLHPNPGDPLLGASWPGGYYCPCHGSRYDLAGRVMDGSPAPLNLPVPPHYYKDAKTIVAGELANGSEQNWEPNTW
ncbi:MAG: ubiquinol-cytochrome c reductase iron-sulfur subunit [Gammaproteobacteria bacterium]|jgi:ubiquinol-cytochrome c reductase iron-sulfur subunit|nr:ubiquinol-cytochrome c reductase iron-sulfur subunit [Gammaproteobacteria bacterium]